MTETPPTGRQFNAKIGERSLKRREILGSYTSVPLLGRDEDMPMLPLL